MKNFIGLGVSGLLALGVAFPTLAQETTAPTATEPAPAQPENEMNCSDQFSFLDKDGNAILTEDEAPAVYARSRIDNRSISEAGYTKEEFLAACDEKAFDRPVLDEGAPLEGSNSFTEGQAQDRAVAWGVGAVSALTKDDKGIWRGTGTQDGKTVNVAIDYKGNVVTSAQ